MVGLTVVSASMIRFVPAPSCGVTRFLLKAANKTAPSYLPQKLSKQLGKIR
jgi:hypothetical protein